METIPLRNFNPKTRRERLNGRWYLVAPATILREGVLNGSQGPLFYPADQIQKDPQSWNGMPITVNHPTEDGVPVSARSPKIIEKFGIGTVYQARYGGRLRTELWFDEELTRNKAPSIWTAVSSGQPVELSTGLFTVNVPSRGEFRGKPYTHIARDYRPDHLAVLTHEPGACSVSDGCGVNVNSDSTGGPNCGTGAGGFKSGNTCGGGGGGGVKPPTPQGVRKIFESVGADMSSPDGEMTVVGAGRIAQGSVKADTTGFKFKKSPTPGEVWVSWSSGGFFSERKIKSAMEVAEKAKAKLREKGYEVLSPIHTNPLALTIRLPTTANNAESLDMTPDKACEIVKDGEVHGKKLTKAQHGMFGAKCGERDMAKKTPAANSSTVECPECGGKMKKGKKCRCGYKEGMELAPETNSLTDDSTTTTTTTFNFTVTQGDDPMKLTPEQRKEHVSYLTANCDCWKRKGDEAILNGLSDEKLSDLRTGAEKAAQVQNSAKAAPVVNASMDDDGDECEPKAKKVQNSTPARPKTAKEWLAEAPPEIQSAVQNAMRIDMRERQVLASRLVANIADETRRKEKFASLMQRDLAELTELVELIPVGNSQASRSDTPEYDNSHLSLTPYAPDVSLSANSRHDGEKEALLPFTMNSEADDDPVRKRLKALVG